MGFGIWGLGFGGFLFFGGAPPLIAAPRDTPPVVGSKNERPGRTGFAHLFEHMMFKGSKNVEPDRTPR